MSGPKCNLPEAERARILAQVPAFLTQEEEDAIRDMFPQYLFFRNEYEDDGFHVSSAPVRMCICTACGETFSAVRGNWPRGKMHHEMCNCPNCGRQVEAIAVGKYKYSMPSLEQWCKTAVLRVLPDGALQIEAGDALRRFTHDDLVGEIVWRPEKRYYFKRPSQALRASSPDAGEPRSGRRAGGGESRGTVQAWTLRLTEWSCDGNHRYKWFPMKTVPDAFAPNFSANYNGDYKIVGLREALEHPDWKYCQMEEFYHYQYAADIIEDWTTGQRAESARWLVLYLAWYALHPQIEMAVKLGFAEAVEELIERDRKNARLLNWNADTPGGFLRMGKRDAKIFIRAQMRFRDLKVWKQTAKGGSFSDYMAMVDMAGGAENLHRISEAAAAHGIALKTAARYIARLAPVCRYAPPTGQIIQTWRDYLDMAKSLNYDLTEETVLMPRNLQERHDAAAETLGELDRLDEIKAYKIRRKQLEKKYGFKLGGLRILIPNSAEEIIAEGKTLHHCVGGYAARHVQGKTVILFLRNAKKPMRSFLTIEMVKRQGRMEIMQIHGYRNEGYANRKGEREAVNPRVRYAWFLDVWLDWVNSGSKRDRDGNPVLPDADKTKEAAV